MCRYVVHVCGGDGAGVAHVRTQLLIGWRWVVVVMMQTCDEGRLCVIVGVQVYLLQLCVGACTVVVVVMVSQVWLE